MGVGFNSHLALRGLLSLRERIEVRASALRSTEHEFGAFAGGVYFDRFAAFFCELSGFLQHHVDLSVVMVRIVVK
jgi:hypothetical protein